MSQLLGCGGHATSRGAGAAGGDGEHMASGGGASAGRSSVTAGASMGGASSGGAEVGGAEPGGAEPGGTGGTPSACGELDNACCEAPHPTGGCQPGLICMSAACTLPPDPGLDPHIDIARAPSDFGNPGWRDSWFVLGCAAKDGDYCQTVASCPPAGVETAETFSVGGEPGTHYKITFRFSAVLSPKRYQGGTADAIPQRDPEAVNHDTFYRDGQPLDVSGETWQLTVLDDKGQEARRYYLNAMSAEYEADRTYSALFTKSIVVLGGGSLRHSVRDPDCRVLDNWVGASSDDTTPRRLPIDADIRLPANYQDPATGQIVDTALLSAFGDGRNQPWHAQAGHLLVTHIEDTGDPVEHDY